MSKIKLQWLMVGIFTLGVGTLLAETPFTRVIPAQQLRQQLENFVHQHLAPTTARYQVEYLSPLSDWKVENAVDSIAVTAAGHGPLRGNVVLYFQAFSGDRLLRKRTYSIRIRTFEPVAVLAQPVQRGDSIPFHAISIVTKETTFLKGQPIHFSASDTLFARRNLPQGHILTEADVRHSLLIKRGETAMLLFQQGVLQITLKARALNDASKGETIWFILPNNRKRIRATVVGNHIARIQPLTGEILP